MEASPLLHLTAAHLDGTDAKQSGQSLVRLYGLRGSLAFRLANSRFPVRPNLVGISQKGHFGKIVGPQVCIEKV